MPACRSRESLPDAYPPDSPYRALIEHRLRELRARLPQAFDPRDVGELLVTISRSDGTQLRWPADATARKVLATMFAQDDATRDAFLRGVSGTDWWSEGGSAAMTRRIVFPAKGQVRLEPFESRAPGRGRDARAHALQPDEHRDGNDDPAREIRSRNALRGAFLLSAAEDRSAGGRPRRGARRRRRGVRSRRPRLHAHGAHLALDARCRAMLARAGRDRSQSGLLVRTRQDGLSYGACGPVRPGRHGAHRRRRAGRADGGALGAVRRAREHRGRRPVRARLQLAGRGGATDCHLGGLADLHGALLDASQGEGFELVVDTTGNPAVFAAALGIAAPFGKLVLLGDTGYPSRQALSSDMMTKGLTIVATHDHHDRGGWTQRRIDELFFKLVRDGLFTLDGLITHEFAPGDCEAAYALVSDRREEAVGVLFDWTQD